MSDREFIQKVMAEIEVSKKHFIEHEHLETAMTGKERMRLIGAGVRNYGFIEKSYEIAVENPQFVSNFFSAQDMRDAIDELDDLRQVLLLLEQFSQAVNECMLVKADECFRHALKVYGTLREHNKSKVPGADALFSALLQYFRRPKRSGQPEQTEKELEDDLQKMARDIE